MSRIGKIARLPRAVREELNWRLLDGEQQSRLVEWLNGREEVQAVLKAEFDGKAINEPNLTAWAQGGFEDWRREQEAAEAAGRMMEETNEYQKLAESTGSPHGQARGLADRAAIMAALAIGEQFMAVRRMEDGAEKRKAVLKLVRGLVRLRNSERACERSQREAAQAGRSAEMHEEWAERAGRNRRPEDRGRTAGLTEDRGRTAGLSEHDYEHEHEHEDAGGCGGVREQMVEIIAGMSDEEIAESLRRSGRVPRARPIRQGSRQTPRVPPKRVWWTEEDQALEGSDDEDGDGEARPPKRVQPGAAGSGDPALQPRAGGGGLIQS